MEPIKLDRDCIEELERHYLVLKLIEIRERKKMSQHEMARRSKTKQSAISDFETNETRNPSMRILQRYARAVGYRLEINLVKIK